MEETKFSVKKRREEAGRMMWGLLPENGSEEQWGTLWEKAKAMGMGRATLSAHLKELTRLGLVDRRVDTTTYPPSVYYRRHSPERPFLSVIGGARNWESWIKRLGESKDRELAEQLLEGVLKFNIHREMTRVALMCNTETYLKSPGGRAIERVKKAIEIQVVPAIIEMVKVCLVDPELARPITDRVFNYFMEEEKKAAVDLGGTLQKIMKEEEEREEEKQEVKVFTEVKRPLTLKSHDPT